jgi:hypothetical protein
VRGEEAGVNEKKEKEALPKRQKIISRRHGVTFQNTLISTFLSRHCGSWFSLFLRNRQIGRSNTGPKPDILTVVVMVFPDNSREIWGQYYKLYHDCFLPLAFRFNHQ